MVELERGASDSCVNGNDSGRGKVDGSGDGHDN